MKRIALLAMALLLALVLTGCAQDESKMLERGVIRVGSIQYTYGDLLEVEATTREYYAQMNMVYAMYGLQPMEMTDAQIRDEALNSLAIQAIVLDKAHKMGLTTLTNEEKIEVSARTDAAMAERREAMAATLALPEDMPEAEREAAIDAAMEAAGITRAKVYRSEWENFVIEKTRAWAVSGVTVSEEEFMAAFNAQVESEMASITEDPTSYGLMVLNGQTPLYAPAGYREVEWFYIATSDADVTLVAGIEAALAAAEEEVAACEETVLGLLGAEADVDALVAQVTVTLAEVTDPANITVEETIGAFDPPLSNEEAAAVMALADARALQNAYAEQLEQAIAAANATIAEEVEDALRRLANGESWDLVQEHFNDDVDMYYGSPVICADFPYVAPVFTDAAMALAAPGDWTTEGVYEDGYGCFIIRYVGDVAEGAVDPATVRDAMMADLLATKQEESFSSTLSLWVDAASSSLYINYSILGE